VKLLRTMKLVLSEDARQEELLFSGSFTQVVEDVLQVAESATGSMLLATLAVDVALPLGPVTTATRLLILSDKDITLKLNGGSTVVDIKANGDRGVFYLEGAVTAVALSNAGATAANILYALAGV
jgi:hypothetical protein